MLPRTAGAAPLAAALIAALASCTRAQPAPPDASRQGRAERVVALAPNLAEIAADLGGGPRLVGVSSYGAVPRGAASAERVGGFTDPSIERIIALRPDLVLGVPLQRRALESCRTAGLRVLEVECQTVTDVLEAYETIGGALGLEEEGRRARRELQGRLEAIKGRTAGRPAPRTLFLLGQAGEDLRQVFPVARGNFGDELLQLAGGRNVLDEPVPTIGPETVISLAPEVVIEVAMDDEGAGEVRRLRPSPLWARLHSVPAVQAERVHALSASSLLVPGPRMDEGAALLAEILHGRGDGDGAP